MITQIPKRKDMVGQRYVSWRTYQTLYLGCRNRYYPWFKSPPKPKYFRFIDNRAIDLFYDYEYVEYSYAFFGPTFARLERL